MNVPFFATTDYLANFAWQYFKVWHALMARMTASASACACATLRHLSSLPGHTSVLSTAPLLQAYLPPQMGQASETYDPWVAAWFSSAGTVVPARQVPLGALAPHICPISAQPEAWALEVHFTQRWPEGVCPFVVPAEAAARAALLCNPRHMFFNTLKEACFMRTGASQSAQW
jgi:Autophagy protein Apg5